MKLKVTHKHAYEMHNAINKMSPHVKLFKLMYALSRSLSRLREVVEAIEAAKEGSKAYEKFVKARMSLLSEHGRKDDGGGLMFMPSGEVQLDNVAEWNKALAELEEEHAESVKEQEDKEEALKTLLKVEVEIDFYQIQGSTLEGEGIFTDDAPGFVTELAPLYGFVLVDHEVAE